MPTSENHFLSLLNRTSGKYLITSIIIINSVVVFAQQRPYAYQRYRVDSLMADRKINIIKTNLLSFLAGDLNLAYERLSRNAPRSFVVRVEYNYFTSPDFDLLGGSIQPGIRYYLTKKRQPPAGYYIQPSFLYGEYTVRDKTQNIGAHITLIGGGIIGGKQWAFGKRFTAEVYLGGEYVSLSANNYKANGVAETFLPEIGGSVGFRFN